MHNSTPRISWSNKLKVMAFTLALLGLQTTHSYAQNNQPIHQAHGEDFGNTLNIGLGFVYFPYLDNSVPIVMLDYEFNVARDFTLAPFIGFASYTSGDNYNYHGDYYYYRQTIIPVGVKGTYYFDRLLNLNRRWDLYGAASLGFTYNHVTWEDGYGGSDNVNGSSHLYLDLHAGAEYHVSRRCGIFLDLSTGVSTVGLAIHHR